jgi:hypothetical protein
MKIFKCQNCGNTLYFNNDTCLSCGFKVGYVPELFTLSALTPDGERMQALADLGKPYIFCHNAAEAACNWLVPADSGETFCLACRYNLTIPDLSVPDNLQRWQKIEQAKKHLFYSLTRFELPIPARRADPQNGLGFEFLADVENLDGTVEKVLTGHANGLISINIAEADDAEREQRRAAMGEPYRTLIGHFRHEIGHFYWDLLIRDGGRLDAFKALFGDPDQDYAAALQQHYQNGAPFDWRENYISAYASAHPWEDFAETWAHCFHMVDGLETARVFGITPDVRLDTSPGRTVDRGFDPYQATSIEPVIASWVPLTVAINSLNRSLGQPDFYPFVLTAGVITKIDFVLRLIVSAQKEQEAAQPPESAAPPMAAAGASG